MITNQTNRPPFQQHNNNDRLLSVDVRVYYNYSYVDHGTVEAYDDNDDGVSRVITHVQKYH